MRKQREGVGVLSKHVQTSPLSVGSKLGAEVEGEAVVDAGSTSTDAEGGLHSELTLA